MIAVISTASSLGDEITHAYLQLFSSLGVRDVVGIRPESRAQAADPGMVAAVEGATGVFMTGGNQTKLASIVLGTPLGRGDPGRPRPRRAGRGHVGRGEHLLRAHGVVRQRRLDPEVPGRPGVAGSRAARRGDRGPALHPAEPVRPAARAGRGEPGAARHGHRRGHRRGDPARRRDGGQGPRGGHRRRRDGRHHHRLHGDRHPAADDVRHPPAHAAAGRGVRPDEAGAGLRARAARTPPTRPR